MRENTSNHQLVWQKRSAIVRRRPRKLQNDIPSVAPLHAPENHTSTSGTVHDAKLLCRKLLGERNHRQLVSNTEDQQVRDQVNAALLLVRMDNLDISQRQRFNLVLPQGVDPTHPHGKNDATSHSRLNETTPSTGAAQSSTQRRPKWEAVYAYTLEDPRQLAAMSTIKSDKGSQPGGKNDKGSETNARMDPHSLDDSSVFPPTKIVVDPMASIDALKTLVLEVDLPAPYYLEIGRRYARAEQESQALQYLARVIAEEPPQCEVEFLQDTSGGDDRVRDDEACAAGAVNSGTNESPAPKASTATSEYDLTLDELLARKATAIRTAMELGEATLPPRDKSWFDQYMAYLGAHARERLRRRRMAHHIAFEVLLRHAYNANSHEEDKYFYKAKHHIIEWLATFPDNGATCKAQSPRTKGKRKRKANPQGFREGGHLTLAQSIRCSPFGKLLGSKERQQRHQQRNQQQHQQQQQQQQQIKRTQQQLKLEPPIKHNRPGVIPNSGSILEALTEVHHTITGLRDVLGPLRAHTPGSVASAITIGPLGDLHIAILERLCAKMLGLSDVHDLLLTRNVAAEFHGLDHLDKFGGTSAAMASLATPPALTAESVRSKVVEYSASDLFLSLGELYSLRKEYSKAESLLSLYSRASLNPAFTCNVHLHKARLEKFKNSQISTVPYTAVPNLEPVVTAADRINNMAAVASSVSVRRAVSGVGGTIARLESNIGAHRLATAGDCISSHKWTGSVDTYRVAPGASQYAPSATPVRLGAKLLCATAGSDQATQLEHKLTWWRASPEVILPSRETFIGTNGVRFKRTQPLSDALCAHVNHNPVLQSAMRESVEWDVHTETPVVHRANLSVLNGTASLQHVVRQDEQRGMLEEELTTRRGEAVLTLREHEAKVTWQKAHCGLAACVEEPPARLAPDTQIQVDKTMQRAEHEMRDKRKDINLRSLGSGCERVPAEGDTSADNNRFKNAWTLGPLSKVLEMTRAYEKADTLPVTHFE